MNKEDLIRSGIDYEEGLDRFSGSVQLYEKYLLKLPELTLYEEMKAAINEGDNKAAFEAAHKLKSFTGNLSLGHFHDNVVALTEQLRNGEAVDPREKLAELDTQYDMIVKAIRGDGHVR